MGKRKGKIKLPTDRNGTPIYPGDWLMFDDGPFHATFLTAYDVGGWTAEDENDRFSDNLENGVVITMEVSKD